MLYIKVQCFYPWQLSEEMVRFNVQKLETINWFPRYPNVQPLEWHICIILLRVLEKQSITIVYGRAFNENKEKKITND